MNCEKADLLIMKYMDGEINISEAKLLNSHLLGCKECKEGFKIYDLLLLDMEELDGVEAPYDFEKAVMVKITSLPKVEKNQLYSRRDKLKLIFGGGFVSFLSVGMVLVNNREALIENLAKHPVFTEYTKELAYLCSAVEEHTQNLILFTGRVIQNTEVILGAGAGIISWGIVGLCILQIILVKQRQR